MDNGQFEERGRRRIGRGIYALTNVQASALSSAIAVRAWAWVVGADVVVYLVVASAREFNLLHRLEFNRSTGRAVLLVQSSARPDWSTLGEGYADKIESKTLHDKYAGIANGMILRFRLQANPTKRIGKSDNIADARFKDAEKRRRVDIRTDEGRIAWLKRKGEECGFRLTALKIKDSIENLASVQQGKVEFRRDRNAPKVTFGSVVFEGVLQVTDSDAFKNALSRGIGTGKAYGFGLMSVAAAKES